MFAQVMLLFVWIAAMQCTAIANPLLCPPGPVSDCHEGLRLRHREMVIHAAGFVHSAAEQSDNVHNKNSPSDVIRRIRELFNEFKKVQEDATAAERDKERAVNSKKEVEEAEEEMKKHKSPSTSSSSSWGRAKTPVFQWDESFIKVAKDYADNASRETEVAKNKAAETAKMAEEAFQNAQKARRRGTRIVETAEKDFQSIEESMEDAIKAITEVRQYADAAQIAAYYVKTMVVSHGVFKTVENITYMSTKSKSLIKEAESGIKEAESYLDLIPREFVPKVKKFTEPIKALVDPLKQLQATSEQAVNHAKVLETIINEDKERIKNMTSVQEASCTWVRVLVAAGFVDDIADPVKKRTPFLNDAIVKGDEAKSKGDTAKMFYNAWYLTTTNEKIKEIKEAVAREKEEEKLKKKKETQISPTPPVTEFPEPLIYLPSKVMLSNCSAGGSGKIQIVDLDAIKPEGARDDSTVSMEGDGQERDVKAADAPENNAEHKREQGVSFRTAEQPSSDGDISTKETFEEATCPADLTQSNEFSDNGSSARGLQRGGLWDNASTMPSACAYALLTLIMFLVTVQR